MQQQCKAIASVAVGVHRYNYTDLFMVGYCLYGVHSSTVIHTYKDDEDWVVERLQQYYYLLESCIITSKYYFTSKVFV